MLFTFKCVLGKDDFVRKHHGKDGLRRSKRGGLICRSFLFVFVVAVVRFCLFAFLSLLHCP